MLRKLKDMKKIIYADHAATTKMSEAAYLAMVDYMKRDYANPSSLYQLSRYARQKLREAREKIAGLIGAKPQEIYFTSGGTESDNWTIKGVAGLYPSQRKRIITSSIEHHALLRSCEFLEAWGYEIVHLPVNPEGVVAQQMLEKAIDENTILVSVMLANNEVGTIQPIGDLTHITHKRNIPFHTDAVQAVGHIPVNVQELGVDMLSASAHKFGGPRGIGFLYVREGCEIVPFHHGGGQENGVRAGTEDVASIVSMSVALEESCKEMERSAVKLRELESIILDELDEIGISYRLNGSRKKLPGLMSLSFPGLDGEKIMHRLDMLGVCVSTGSACNSRETEVSHVLRAIAMGDEYARGTIRISLGKDNTPKEAQEIAVRLKKAVGYI